jgi:hypothetical protein
MEVRHIPSFRYPKAPSVDFPWSDAVQMGPGLYVTHVDSVSLFYFLEGYHELLTSS